jgi:hypothetical protein
VVRRQFLECSKREVFEMFEAQHPHLMGLSTFCDMKPFNVKPLKITDNISCTCKYGPAHTLDPKVGTECPCLCFSKPLLRSESEKITGSDYINNCEICSKVRQSSHIYAGGEGR